MKKKALLEYIHETEDNYFVKNQTGEEFVVAKERQENDTLPMASRLPIFHRPFYSLLIAAFGLLSGGLLTIIAASIAIYYLYFLLRNNSLDAVYRVRAKSFLYLAGLLMIIGVPLTALSFMHIFY